jgi:hypothetical protein
MTSRLEEEKTETTRGFLPAFGLPLICLREMLDTFVYGI